MTGEWWRVAREWNGETCFIVAGGPSLGVQDLAPLQGARVIAVNSSWRRVPFADVLFFGDSRWFDHYGEAALAAFAGRVATVAPTTAAHPRLLFLRRAPPPGLATSPDAVMVRRTSVTGAMNLAVHLGVDRICLLGVDNCLDREGRTHHHNRHPWDLRRGWQEEQRDDFATLVAPLQARGIAVVNASPISNLPFWPLVELRDEANAIAARHARVRRQLAPAGASPAIHDGP